MSLKVEIFFPKIRVFFETHSILQCIAFDLKELPAVLVCHRRAFTGRTFLW